MKRKIIYVGILIVTVIVIWYFFFKTDIFNIFSQPKLTTNAVTAFTDSTATLGGNITRIGKPPYIERGVVFATKPNPTTANNKTPVDGLEKGSFDVNVTGLTANTRYYARAYVINEKGTFYGNQVRFTTTAIPNAIYILDDGSAETNFSYFNNFALGNQFNPGEHEGVITSVEVYAINRSDNKNNQVVLDIYNTQRQLVGSSAPFTLVGDDWVNVSINNVSYSGTFYVMVRWPASDLGTHGVGYDTNGNYVNARLNWLRDNSGNWRLLHEVSSQYNPGVFMIRVNVNTTGTGVVTDRPAGNLPVLATSNAAAITSNTVAIAGNIFNVGTPPYTERGIVYCTHENPIVTCSKNVVEGAGTTGIYSVQLRDLNANTTYYARAYAISEDGTAYGNEITFTTSSPADLPTLTTNNVTNVTASTATVDGEIVNAGKPEYTERGFAYCTHANPSVTCSKVVVVGSGKGNFSSDLSGLRANTIYYVRSYAITTEGAFYGNETTFTTHAAPDEELPEILEEETHAESDEEDK